MMHCHYLIAVEDASLGMPEVMLPVIPGMEGCHWPLRRVSRDGHQRITQMLLTGEPVKTKEAVGWLVDYAGPIDACLQMVWKVVSGGNHGLAHRPVAAQPLEIAPDVRLPAAGDAANEAARVAVMECIRQSCRVTLAEALSVQANCSGSFMAGRLCNNGVIGTNAVKTLGV